MNKLNKSIKLAVLLAFAFQLFSACEWDAAEPMYNPDKDYPNPPVITGIDPAQGALPGVNYITINGNNFSPNAEENRVYFDNTEAEILTNSTSSIRVRRPALVSDTATVKVVSYDAFEVARMGPYMLAKVQSEYFSLVDKSLALDAATMDAAGNLYVLQNSPRSIHKVSPSGELTTYASEAPRRTSQALIAPNGNLLLLAANNVVSQVDVNSGEVTEYVSTGERVAYGDFDSNGNLLLAGRRTGIVTVKPDLSVNVSSQLGRGEAVAVRFYNGNLYVAAGQANPPEGLPAYGIWRFPVDADGNVSDPEAVLDIETTPGYEESEITGIAFDANGTMYIAVEHADLTTGSPNPIITVTPGGDADILYKDMIGNYPHAVFWGNGTELFMVQGGDQWQVTSIDLGVSGAPYYGQ